MRRPPCHCDETDDEEGEALRQKEETSEEKVGWGRVSGGKKENTRIKEAAKAKRWNHKKLFG